MSNKQNDEIREQFWETQNGEEIEYKKLTDSHLFNILKWIEKRAKDGITITVGSCSGEFDTWWGDVYEIKGKEVLERYDYKGLKKEAKRRKLVSPSIKCLRVGL